MPAPIVAATALNATDNPGPGVGVLRSLRAPPAEVSRLVGLTYDALDPGVYAPDVADDVFLIPYPSQGVDALRDRLSRVLEATPVDVLIPTLDSELVGFLELEPFLTERGVKMFVPSREQLTLRDKSHLQELADRAGIVVPRQRTVSDVEELFRLGDDVDFPLFVKGVFYGAHIAWSVAEAVAAYHDTVARWGLPVVLQERVVGDEVDVAAVGDGEGGLVGMVAMKKTLLTEKGKGWAGVSILDEDLTVLARRFMSATQWRGPCELEFVRKEDGGYVLIEVNPRFPAWIFLSAGAGVNLPWMVVELALGRRPAPGHLAVGTLFVRISLDQIVPLEAFAEISQRGELHRGPSQRGEPPAPPLGGPWRGEMRGREAHGGEVHGGEVHGRGVEGGEVRRGGAAPRKGRAAESEVTS